MPLFPDFAPDTRLVCRTDPDDLLGSFAPYGFELDGHYWPTVEHYFQGMKFLQPAWQQRVREADGPALARRLGRRRFKPRHADWRQRRLVVMTRALYIRAKTHPQLAQALLETDDRPLMETTLYDYFWGCGRDRRGHNHYGKLLMQVRQKLRQELESATTADA